MLYRNQKAYRQAVREVFLVGRGGIKALGGYFHKKMFCGGALFFLVGVPNLLITARMSSRIFFWVQVWKIHILLAGPAKHSGGPKGQGPKGGALLPPPGARNPERGKTGARHDRCEGKLDGRTKAGKLQKLQLACRRELLEYLEVGVSFFFRGGFCFRTV